MRSCWEPRLSRPIFTELFKSFNALRLSHGDSSSLQSVILRSSSKSQGSTTDNCDSRSGVSSIQESEEESGSASPDSDSLAHVQNMPTRQGRAGYQYCDASTFLKWKKAPSTAFVIDANTGRYSGTGSVAGLPAEILLENLPADQSRPLGEPHVVQEDRLEEHGKHFDVCESFV